MLVPGEKGVHPSVAEASSYIISINQHTISIPIPPYALLPHGISGWMTLPMRHTPGSAESLVRTYADMPVGDSYVTIAGAVRLRRGVFRMQTAQPVGHHGKAWLCNHSRGAFWLLLDDGAQMHTPHTDDADYVNDEMTMLADEDGSIPRGPLRRYM